MRLVMAAAVLGLMAPVGAIQASEWMILHPIAQRPGDCLAHLPVRNSPSAPYDWRDTIEVEHCDRIKRLWRIADEILPGSPPDFYDTRIPAEVLPPALRVKVPVLRVVFADRVFFDTDSAVLRTDADNIVAVVSESLHHEPDDVSVFVAGHTDSRQTRAYNQRLSERRAAAVAEALMRRPSNVAHVWKIGFGKDFPLVPNDSAAHMALNRRVEFLIAGREEAIIYYLQQLQDVVCAGVPQSERAACLRSEKISLNPHNYVATLLDRAVPVAPKPPTTAAVEVRDPATQVQMNEPRQVIIVPRWDHVEIPGVQPRGIPQKVDP